MAMQESLNICFNTQESIEPVTYLPYNPNEESGFLKLGNNLKGALLNFGFTKRQLMLVNAIIQKTVGWNKIEDDISASQLEIMTGIARSHCSTVLTQLAKLNVISKRRGHYGQIISINAIHFWKPRKAKKNFPAATKKETGATQLEYKNTKCVAAVLPKGNIHKTTTKNNFSKETTTTPQQENPNPNPKKIAQETNINTQQEKLVFPEQFTKRQKQKAKKIIARAPVDLQVAILVYLASVLNNPRKRIRIPIAYLTTLVDEANNGTFKPLDSPTTKPSSLKSETLDNPTTKPSSPKRNKRPRSIIQNEDGSVNMNKYYIEFYRRFKKIEFIPEKYREVALSAYNKAQSDTSTK